MNGREDAPTRALEVILLAIIVGAAVGGSIVTYVVAAQPAEEVTVGVCHGEIPASFVYSGSSSGFMSSSYGIHPAYCEAMDGSPGFVFSSTLFLHSSDSSAAHTVQAVRLDGPFVLASMSPGLPSAIAPGGNLSFSLSIQAPQAAGSYSPEAVVTVW